MQQRLSSLANDRAGADPAAPTALEQPWWRRGAAGLVTLAVILLSKLKFLILGLTKASTFVSMFAFFGVYWSLYGWPLAAGLVLDRIVVRAEHLRVVPGLPPRIQAAPVSLRAYVSQENVDRWTRTARLPMRLALTEEGVLLTTGVGGIRMSETLADLEVSGAFLRLAPKRMTIVGLPAPMLRFVRGYLPLPPLPKGARITNVRPSDGRIAVTFSLDALDEPLTPDIARRLRSATRLPLPGLG